MDTPVVERSVLPAIAFILALLLLYGRKCGSLYKNILDIVYILYLSNLEMYVMIHSCSEMRAYKRCSNLSIVQVF